MNFAARINGDTPETARLSLEATDAMVTREPIEGGELILIGRIYEPYASLQEVAGRLVADPESCTGRFLFVRHDFAAGRLQIFSDAFRLLGAMYSHQDGCFWFGNHLHGIPQSFHLTKDPVSVASLKAFGTTVMPRTLFREVKMLMGNLELDLKSGGIYVGDHGFQQTGFLNGPVPEVEDWLTELRGAVADIFRHWAPAVFRLSGGADSRLIAMLLNDQARGRIRGEVLCHPDLTPDEDRDVIGALGVGRLFGFPVNVLRLPHHVYFMQNEERFTYCLGGLYGGEFLGGLMYRFAPWCAPTPHPAPPATPELEMAREEWAHREKLLGMKLLTLELYLSAFRSVIYESTEFSWSSPRFLQTAALSPFVESRILKMLLRTPDADLLDYGVYYRIFCRLGGLDSGVALNSSLALHHSAVPRISEGVDPKTVARKGQVVTPPTATEIRDRNLENFFSGFPVRDAGRAATR